MSSLLSKLTSQCAPLSSIDDNCHSTLSYPSGLQDYSLDAFQYRRDQGDWTSWPSRQPLSRHAKFANKGHRVPGDATAHLDREA